MESTAFRAGWRYKADTFKIRILFFSGVSLLLVLGNGAGPLAVLSCAKRPRFAILFYRLQAINICAKSAIFFSILVSENCCLYTVSAIVSCAKRPRFAILILSPPGDDYVQKSMIFLSILVSAKLLPLHSFRNRCSFPGCFLSKGFSTVRHFYGFQLYRPYFALHGKCKRKTEVVPGARVFG